MDFIDDYVYENLPQKLKVLCGEFEGRERDIVLLSSLWVLSGCMPNVNFIYDSKTVYLNLYGLIIAPPASGKGAMRHSYSLVEPIHNRIYSESVKVKEQCEEEKGKSNCPSLSMKVIPGNITSAKLYGYLKSIDHGLIIHESEADSLSNMLKNELGDFSDVLRKAFHHEKVSVSRQTDDKFIQVDKPELSIILSGTPDQLKPLLKSVDNGLFSRFMYYYFDDATMWNDDILLNKCEKDLSPIFDQAGKDIYDLYGNLLNREMPIQFKLEMDQRVRLNNLLKYANDQLLLESENLGYSSNLKRLALITYRICGILSVIRHADKLDSIFELNCTDEDFNIAIWLLKLSLDHGIKVQQLFALEGESLDISELHLLKHLPNRFTRSESIKIGIQNGLKERTIDNRLKSLCKKEFLAKYVTGQYRMTDSSLKLLKRLN